MFHQNRNKKFSVRFFIKKPTSGRSAPIFVRIIFRRKKVEIATGLKIVSLMWDKTSGRAINDEKLNYDLDKIRVVITERKAVLEEEKRHLSIKHLKSDLLVLLGGEGFEPRTTILGYFKKYIERIEQMKYDYSEGTIKHYKSAFSYFEKFLESRDMTNLPLEEADYEFISQLDEYLRSRPGNLKPITVATKHAKLRAVLYDAVRKGHLKRNPYIGFKVKTSKSQRMFLSREEVISIQQMDFSNNGCLDRVKDLFLFSVYTGLRFSDAQDLRKEHLHQDGDQCYISRIIQKTDRQFMLPLLQPAMEIISKYRYLQRIDGRLLPKISNQKFNKYIKYIGELAGIQKKITHHVARHTFATTITLSNRVPVEVVKEWLGHSNIRETMIYAKVTAYSSLEHAKKLNSRFSSVSIF